MSRETTSGEVVCVDDGWLMWAVPETFESAGHRRFAGAFVRQGTMPVRVRVAEDPDGTFLGWLARDDNYPRMIYGHPAAFRLCFPYGPAAEEAAGKGRVVRLRIEPVES